jgi:hypothetical protein
VGSHLRQLLGGRRAGPATEPDGPCSFLTLEHGTPVVDCFGEDVGRVARVLVASPGTFFDGIVVRTSAGERFVDAPEVARIGTDCVHLANTVDDVHARRPSHAGVTERDRREAIDALKRAYVGDRIDANELGDLIKAAYEAGSVEELERVLPG